MDHSITISVRSVVNLALVYIPAALFWVLVMVYAVKRKGPKKE